MSNKIPKLLTIEEVARIFGLNPMTIYRKARSGDIPALKLGRCWRIPEDDLQAWIKSRAGGGRLSEKTDLASVNFGGISQIKLVYFFGSAASGETTPLSDIDVAYFDDGSISPFDLEPALERAILEKFPDAPRIDMVRLNAAPAVVQYRVIREGRLLYSMSDVVRADFEEGVVNRYLDYAPVIKQFYKDAA